MSFISGASEGSSSDHSEEISSGRPSSPSEGLQGRKVKKKQAGDSDDETTVEASSQTLKREREEAFKSGAPAAKKLKEAKVVAPQEKSRAVKAADVPSNAINRKGRFSKPKRQFSREEADEGTPVAKKATPVRSPGKKMLDHVGRHLAAFVPKESISSFSLVSKQAHKVAQENPSKQVAIEKIAKRPESFDNLGAYLKKDPEVLASLISVRPEKFFSIPPSDQRNRNIIRGFVEAHMMSSGIDEEFESEEINQSEYLDRCGDIFRNMSAEIQEKSALSLVEKNALLFSLKQELFLSAFSTIKDGLSLDNVLMVTYPEVENLDPESLPEDQESLDDIYDFIEHISNDLKADKYFMQELICLQPSIVSALLVDSGAQKANPFPPEARTSAKIIDLISDRKTLLNLIENDVRYAGVLDGAHVQKLLADKGNIREFLKIEGAAKYLPVLMKDSADVFKEAVSISSENLEFASDRLKSDAQFIKSLIASSPDSLKYASNALKNDRQFIKELVSITPKSLKYASKALKNDRQFIKDLVSLSPESFRYASHNLRESDEFIEELFSFPPERKRDTQFIKNVVAVAPTGLKFASDALKDDKEFIRELVVMAPKIQMPENMSHCVLSILFASERLKNDAQFIKELISSVSDCPLSLMVLVSNMSNTICDNQEVMSEFVRSAPNAIMYASDRIRDDEKIMEELEAVASQPLSHIPRLREEMI